MANNFTFFCFIFQLAVFIFALFQLISAEKAEEKRDKKDVYGAVGTSTLPGVYSCQITQFILRFVY